MTKHRRREPEYEPVLRQEPHTYPASMVPTGEREAAALRENDQLWQVILTAASTAIQEQSLLEDLQSLTLEQRLALRLMQSDLTPFTASEPEGSIYLSFRWAIALAAVLVEVLPQTGLADTFIEALQSPDFRTKVSETYMAWYLPTSTDQTETTNELR